MGEKVRVVRSPMYHPPAQVVRLYRELEEAWEKACSEHPLGKLDEFRIEIERVLKVYRYAAENTLCVVSVMDLPIDEERASRIHIPLKLE